MLIYFLLTFLYNTQVTTFTAEWMYACLIRTEKNPLSAVQKEVPILGTQIVSIGRPVNETQKSSFSEVL